MRIVLTAINAKYIHSNLAVYSLQKSAGEYEPQVQLAEYTINQPSEEIFADLYRCRPDLLLFSCYIWNREQVIEAAQTIRQVLPDTVIWAGGPEVSYDASAFLEENPAFTGVMIGEGEKTYYKLLQYYAGGIGSLADIPGLAVRRPEGGLLITPAAPLGSDLDDLPFVYEDLTQFQNRIIYYESSRGCPFSCSYCLSSIDKRVRYRSLDLVLGELAFFLEHNVKQVKFIDRTFNCSHERSMAIWRFLREHDNGITNFHFEISADLLNKEEIELLHTLRPGLVQLEIGVQTLNERALQTIHRTAPYELIAEHVRGVAEGRNIHQHLDLIAGLPYEDLASFRHSFDGVYSLHPQQLQLGFLKVLRGSEMHQRAEEYGIIYRDKPPYEVLQTKWISCEELLGLKETEQMLEIYYNSQQFRLTMEAAETLFATPIELYEALSAFYHAEGLTGKAYSRMQRFEILHAFLQKQQADMGHFEVLLTADLYLRENAKSRPVWAGDLKADQDRTIQFYRREEAERRYLPDHAGSGWKQLMRMTHLERFDYDLQGTHRETWLLFDYAKRDPLTGDAVLTVLDASAL